MRFNKHFQGKKALHAYGTLELLLFLLVATGIAAGNFIPLQKEIKEMKTARTKAAETEINFRKQKYLFESNPRKIEEFNQADDATRWEILSDKVMRNGKNVPDPLAFIRCNGILWGGNAKIFIGRDEEESRVSP